MAIFSQWGDLNTPTSSPAYASQQAAAPTAPTAPTPAPPAPPGLGKGGLRPALQFSQASRNMGGNGLWTDGLWDDMEEIREGHADWDKGVNERFVTRSNGEGSDQYTVRYRPKAGSYLASLGDNYQDVFSSQQGAIDGQDYWQHNLDASKLPGTQMGDFHRINEVTDQTDLFNPDMVVDDEHYGRITNRANIRSGQEMVGPLLMSILGGAMGFLPGISQIGLGAVNTARSLANGGDWRSIAGNLAMQGAGVPGYIRMPANMAISQLTNKKD